QRRSKLDAKSQKGFLVGYCDDDGFRVYVPDRRVIVRSATVTFDEKLLIPSTETKPLSPFSFANDHDFGLELVDSSLGSDESVLDQSDAAQERSSVSDEEYQSAPEEIQTESEVESFVPERSLRPRETLQKPRY